MQTARSFTFSDYILDKQSSTLIFTYEVELENADTTSYRDTFIFENTHAELWNLIPKPLLTSLCESLLLIVGIYYWRIHCAPRIYIKNFELSEKQALFWNEVYTKGLGEFFYKVQKDFRGLVSFPFTTEKKNLKATSFPRKDRALLAQGGGKDSIASAEMLLKWKIPFDLFVVGRTYVQDQAVSAIGKPLVRVSRIRDRALQELKDSGLPRALPSVVRDMLIGILAAALRDYRYVIFSNEYSADIPNTTYLGLDINHQWSKSKEAELLVRDYITSYISRDLVPFSLIRQYSEIDMVRRFSRYPKYFFSFSSCNMNFRIDDGLPTPRPGRMYWCNSCPKCIFIFSCMSAFVPKKTVMEIFGANLHANPDLLPIFKELLGIEGIKPFECVGTAEEMIVAMYRSYITGSYNKDTAMELFLQHFTDFSVIESMERDVFSLHGESTAPKEFMEGIPDGRDTSVRRGIQELLENNIVKLRKRIARL